MQRTTSMLAVAAVAATSVAVGTQLVSGAGADQETVFVPITPCRLVDTPS